MKKFTLLSVLMSLPLIACAEVNLEQSAMPELAKLENACGQWADHEHLKGANRHGFIADCVESLELEYEQTGTVEL